MIFLAALLRDQRDAAVLAALGVFKHQLAAIGAFDVGFGVGLFGLGLEVRQNQHQDQGQQVQKTCDKKPAECAAAP